MPLFGRRIFFSTNDEKSEEIFRLERWTCECSWRTGLTFEAALRSEREIRENLFNLVPPYFHDFILRTIYHNEKTLEKLAEEISIFLNKSFFVGEPVEIRKRRGVKALIENVEKQNDEIVSNDPNQKMFDFKYDVKLIDENQIINRMLPEDLRRVQPVPNREKLKNFIRSFGIRLGNRTESPWIFYDKTLPSKLKLKDRFSVEFIENLRKHLTITEKEILSMNEQKKEKNSFLKKEKEENKEKTLEIVVGPSFVDRLEKTRKERGVDSKTFQRLIFQCARLLNEKQIEKFPTEFRLLIEKNLSKIAENPMDRTTNDEKTKIDDSQLETNRILPEGKNLENFLQISDESTGKLIFVANFLSSMNSIFVLSLNEDFSKFDQQIFRSFRIKNIFRSSKNIFHQKFRQILKIFLKLILKERENRSDDNNNEQNSSSFFYRVQINEIPVNDQTFQEFIRFFLLESNDEKQKILADRLENEEIYRISIDEQISILSIFVEKILDENQLISEFFENLQTNLSEAARERRKLYEENGKKRKLQIQNSDHDTVRTKKRSIVNESLDSSNDENRNIFSTSQKEDFNEFDDDLKMVLQRRRQMVAISKEIKEKREIEAQKQQLEQKRQFAMDKADQNYQEALLNFKNGFRIEPLGSDRDHNRYWFFRGNSGVFVEKNSLDENEASQWLIFDEIGSIKELMNSLDERGIREENLLSNLKKYFPLIEEEFEEKRKSRIQVETSIDETENFHQEMIDSFRVELEQIENRLRLGSLAGFTQNKAFRRWHEKLFRSEERRDFAELLLDLKGTVVEKYFSGIFSIEEKNELNDWTRECRMSKTFSRLHFLMMIFDKSIMWKKSPIGIKCKICRRKQKDESILVCDQCFEGFHPECFRPSMRIARNSFNELWFCSSCRPSNENLSQ